MRIKRLTLSVIIALSVAVIGAPMATGQAHAAAKSKPAPTKKTPASAPAASADPSASCPSDSTAKGQVLQGLGQTGSDCSDNQVNTTLKTVVTLLSMIVGIASVMVIIISGFKYITSGGDQNKVSNAKGSLIYALVGLAVAALAQLMIHFVLYQTNK